MIEVEYSTQQPQICIKCQTPTRYFNKTSNIKNTPLCPVCSKFLTTEEFKKILNEKLLK